MHSTALIRAGVLVALGITPVAFAQEAPEKKDAGEELSEVVVTGYRASLAGALEIKRNSELVVDAISGGDIGALPDVTIAETLVRLPGINGTRDRGNQSQAADARTRPASRARVWSMAAKSHRPSRTATCAGRSIPPKWSRASMSTRRSPPTSSLVASRARSTSRPFVRSTTTVRMLLLRGGAVYYEAGSDFPDYDPYGYRGSGSFTHSVGDNFAFNVGVSLQRQKNAFPSFQGWGYNDRHHLARATRPAIIDGDGDRRTRRRGARRPRSRSSPRDRVGVNGAIGLRSRRQLRAEYRRAVLEVHDRRGPEPGLVRPTTSSATGQWQPVRLLQRTTARARSPQVDGSRGRGDAQQLLGAGDQRHREVHRRQGPVRHGRQRQVRSRRVDHDLRSVALERRAHQPLGRVLAFRWPRTRCSTTCRRARSHQHHRPAPIPADPSNRCNRPTGSRARRMVLTTSRISCPRCALDFARDFEGANLKSLSFGVRASERDKDFFRRQQQSHADDQRRTVAGIAVHQLQRDRVRCAAAAQRQLPRARRCRVRRRAGGHGCRSSRAASGASTRTSRRSTGNCASRARSARVRFNGNAGVRVVQTETTSTGFGSINDGALAAARSLDNDYAEVLPEREHQRSTSPTTRSCVSAWRA